MIFWIDNTNAMKMFDEALRFFEKAGTPIGQGNAYWKKGDIYSRKVKIQKQLKCTTKPLSFLKKLDILWP